MGKDNSRASAKFPRLGDRLDELTSGAGKHACFVVSCGGVFIALIGLMQILQQLF
jgi:hypothetical protein